MSSRFSVRAVAEAGVAIALAVVLDRIKLYEMPQGGSVTLGSMVPIFIVALRHGFGLGLTAGAVFGALQWMMGGYVIHPVQGMLDYPVAFALLGLAGLRVSHFVSVPAAVAARYLAHVLSGVVFFPEYAPVGQSAWVYSLVYNAGYLLPDLAVSALVVMLLFTHPAIRRLLGAPARVQEAA